MSDGHEPQRCAKPRARRRKWRNTVWVCPTCGQGWMSKRSRNAPPTSPPQPGEYEHCGYYSEGSFWGWWPWPNWVVASE